MSLIHSPLTHQTKFGLQYEYSDFTSITNDGSGEAKIVPFLLSLELEELRTETSKPPKHNISLLSTSSKIYLGIEVDDALEISEHTDI